MVKYVIIIGYLVFYNFFFGRYVFLSFYFYFLFCCVLGCNFFCCFGMSIGFCWGRGLISDLIFLIVGCIV